MASNTDKNDIIRNIANTRDTEPASSALTGTATIVAGSKEVIGVGTLFTTELRQGDFLYVPADNEIRRIASISSATELMLETAFTNGYAGGTFRKTPRSNRKEISWAITAGATALIDGVSVPIDVQGGWTKAGADNQGLKTGYVDPVVFDSATVVGNILVLSKLG